MIFLRPRVLSEQVEILLLFANAVSRSGLNQALRDAGREDLIGKSSEIVFNELLWISPPR